MKANELVFEMRIDWRNVQQGVRTPAHRLDHLRHDTGLKTPSVFLPVENINVASVRNRLDWIGRSHYKMFGRYRYYRGNYQTRVAFEGVLFVFADNSQMQQFQEFVSVAHNLASIAA